MSLDSRICSILFSFTAATILALAIACAVAIGAGAPHAFRLPFRLICHGIENRCLLVRGVPMPICARCTGIYAGALAGIALFAAAPPLRRIRFSLLALAVIIAPLALDGLTQAAGLRESTNLLRLATGFPAGAGFLFWALAHIERNAAVRGEAGRGSAS